MKVKVLFTTRDAFFSRLVRDVTKSEVSHCAIEIPSLKMVIHSNIKGVHIEYYKTFRKNNNIIHELDSKYEFDESLLDAIMGTFEYFSYDFFAFMFLGLSLVLRSYLKIPLPKANLWNTSGMICTEFVTQFVDRKADPMITPEALYYKLLESGEWIKRS